MRETLNEEWIYDAKAASEDAEVFRDEFSQAWRDIFLKKPEAEAHPAHAVAIPAKRIVSERVGP